MKFEINMNERRCRTCLEKRTEVFNLSDFIDIDSVYKPKLMIVDVLLECTSIQVIIIQL